MASGEANIPSREEAEHLLFEAQEMNPGPWVHHSKFAAVGAEIIAYHHPQLDPEKAYVLGLLHDIGRREGVTDMRHALDGFKFLQNKGFDQAARICLTHSFPVKNLFCMAGKWDCTDDELNFVENYLGEIEYSVYDRLIQLCDGITLPTGFCLIEKRMIDVALRHGVNRYSVPRWKAFFEIKLEFDKAIGRSIYQLLPGVVENTFDL